MKSWLQSLGVLVLMGITFVCGIMVNEWLPKTDQSLKRAIERTLLYDRDVIACVSNVMACQVTGAAVRVLLRGEERFAPFRCADTTKSNLFGVVLGDGIAYLMYSDPFNDAFGVTRVMRQGDGTYLVSVSTGTKGYGVAVWKGSEGQRNKYIDLHSVSTSSNGLEYVVNHVRNVSSHE